MRDLGRFWLVLLGAMAAGCGGKVNTCDPGVAAGAAAAGTGGTTSSHGATAGTAGTRAGGSAANPGNTAADCSGLAWLYAFDNSLQGFVFNTAAATPPQVNLAAPGAAALEWSGLVDHNVDAVYPHKGSMQVTATFSGWDQQLYVEVGDAAHPLVDSCGSALDLRDKILSVQVRLDAGLSPAAGMPGSFYGEGGPAGCALYVKAGVNLAWGASPLHSLTPGVGWTDIAFDTSYPSLPDLAADWPPANPVTIGILFSSGYGSGPLEPFGSPLPTTIYVDDVVLEPRP